jgi:subtilisin family serine protease
MKRTLALLALATVGVVSAQTVGNVRNFVEIPGQQQFSGRLIARPMPVNNLLRQGFTRAQASVMRAEAREDVQPFTVRFYRETDEYIVQVPVGKTESTYAAELMATGAFQYVEPDWTVFPLVNPNDPSFGSQWHLPKVGAPQAWDLFTANASTTVVAITDTGVRLNHQDLSTQLVSGANTATGTAIAQTAGGLVDDINGHGSHCAGIAAARGNNGLGVSGMGWNMKIMPVRVSNSTGGGSSSSALAAGARWAADNGARVVSTSYSGVSNSTNQTTGAYLRARNVLYFFAAGNSNTNLTTFDHADVTVIGATDQNDAKASFSSYGPGADLFAPGVSIFATYNGSATSYATLSGTSMATPCAAGVATFLFSANPALTTQQVETAMFSTAADLGTAGNDSYWGWGRVNQLGALRWVYNNVPFRADSVQVIQGTSLNDPVGNTFGADSTVFRVSGDTIPVGLLVRFKPTLATPNTIQMVVDHTSTLTEGGRMTFSRPNDTSPNRQNVFAVPQNGQTTVTLNVADYFNAAAGEVQVVVQMGPPADGNRITNYTVGFDRLALFTRPL